MYAVSVFTGKKKNKYPKIRRERAFKINIYTRGGE